jgi:DNA polymerase-3 subunit epsilon
VNPTTIPWHEGPLASFDVESTGTVPAIDRIVSAALIHPDGRVQRWLTDVDGVEIPAAASRVHGISTEHARTHGRPAKQVIEEITGTLANILADETVALVVMNAPFDLGMLNAECARHGVQPLADRIGRLGPIVDPLVIDRAADKYRSGRRNLESLAAHYKVQLVDAHTADADAQAALDVARAIGRRFPDVQVPAWLLHTWQVRWRAQWAAGFEEHLRRSGKPDATVDGSWPVAGGAA